MNRTGWSSWMYSITRLVGRERRGGDERKRPTFLRTRSLQLEPLEQRQMLTILYWDPIEGGGVGGSGTWDASAAVWNTASDGSGSRVTLTANDDAVFLDNAATVTIDGTVSAGSIRFATTGYAIQSGQLGEISLSAESDFSPWTPAFRRR